LVGFSLVVLEAEYFPGLLTWQKLIELGYWTNEFSDQEEDYKEDD
jgi:hypothetical protein